MSIFDSQINMLLGPCYSKRRILQREGMGTAIGQASYMKSIPTHLSKFICACSGWIRYLQASGAFKFADEAIGHLVPTADNLA
jgi:hypothetical protein